MTDVGITAYGAYIPRLRLSREAIVRANGWINSALRSHARGARSMCSWDEDAVTMGVEAARDCLFGMDRSNVRAVHLASTSFPFADRLSAGLLAEALNLPDTVSTLDVASSQRAGTSGLLNALASASAGGATLFVATEHRRTRTGSVEELLYGDGAAALALGTEGVVARLIGAFTLSVDFVDHYRGQNHDFEYGWEERWVRDEGFLKIGPRAVAGALERTGLAGDAIDYFVFPSALRRVPETIAKKVGVRPEAVVDLLQSDCGITGCAHPILLLAQVLESAKAGDKILVAGFGQGCDVLVLEATPDIARHRPPRGVSGSLRRRRDESNYDKFITWNGLVDKDLGKRAEVDKQTALSALYRNRQLLTGFVGGRCTVCGTVQIPKAHYCVNPDCDRPGTQVPHPMADTPARVKTWTADSLTFSMDPPAYFGMVEFEGGGQLMVDFTDVERETFDIGAPVQMQFRIREVDPERGFRKYFWKAVQRAGRA